MSPHPASPAMSLRHVPAAHVQHRMEALLQARQRALEGHPPPPAPGADYWETLFEANAAEALAAIDDVTLPTGFVVRYRFFGQRGRDLLVRPFVARRDTDVASVRRLLDWHAAPDSTAPLSAERPTRDVELLYRHFAFPWNECGVFDYWAVMQEVWSSARWAYSRVIASPEDLARLTAGDGWQTERAVESCQPVVVLGETSARLGVLVHDALQQHAVLLHQIELNTDRSLRYGDAVVVARGPRGYLM